MNRYLVFYQTDDDDPSRTYIEVNADTAQDAETDALGYFDSNNQVIVSVWERVL